MQHIHYSIIPNITAQYKSLQQSKFFRKRMIQEATLIWTCSSQVVEIGHQIINQNILQQIHCIGHMFKQQNTILSKKKQQNTSQVHTCHISKQHNPSNSPYMSLCQCLPISKIRSLSLLHSSLNLCFVTNTNYHGVKG